MNDVVRQFRSFFASLRLTIWLLALAIVLIFWATISQTDLGVWGVQRKFFNTFFVLAHIPGTEIPVPVFPGGYFLGALLFLNLVAAHFERFQLSGRKVGIWLTHFGILLLIAGGFLSSVLQQEFQLRVDEGETKGYSESPRDCELALVDATDPQFDDVVAIPEGFLARGEAVQHPKLPFRVVPKLYYPNAALQMRADAPNAPPSAATQGFGPQIAAAPMPPTYKENERNLPAAVVELVAPEGSLGTWLVSPELPMPQHIAYNHRDWKITLRFSRRYLPFSLTLLKFSHDVYPGTDIPKNFSSRVRLDVPGESGGREALIYMNNPLRAGGLTFYQAGFDNNDKTTILQVVRNPSWRLPYFSCAIIALGMALQFGQHLAGFARRRRAARP